MRRLRLLVGRHDIKPAVSEPERAPSPDALRARAPPNSEPRRVPSTSELQNQWSSEPKRGPSTCEFWAPRSSEPERAPSPSEFRAPRSSEPERAPSPSEFRAPMNSEPERAPSPSAWGVGGPVHARSGIDLVAAIAAGWWTVGWCGPACSRRSRLRFPRQLLPCPVQAAGQSRPRPLVCKPVSAHRAARGWASRTLPVLGPRPLSPVPVLAEHRPLADGQGTRTFPVSWDLGPDPTPWPVQLFQLFLS
jgi:hypothetical protein